MIGKILLIHLILVSSFARDYFVSFDFYVDNSQLKSFHFNCAKAMSFKKSKKKFLFSFPLYKNISATCKKYKNEIVNNLLKKGVYVTSYEVLINSSITQKQKLTFLPKRFDIIIKDAEVYFYLKE
jgi:hypothetical protein